MKTLLRLTLLISLCLVGCKKENGSTHDFTGITTTDEQGQLIGSIDSTDWRLDDNFTYEEKNLFDTIEFRETNFSETSASIVRGNLNTVAFYPNPLTSMGSFYIETDQNIVSFIMVDTEFNRLFSHRVIEFNSLTINFEEFNSGIYRMYYVIQDSQFRIIGMGHGDILKE